MPICTLGVDNPQMKKAMAGADVASAIQSHWTLFRGQRPFQPWMPSSGAVKPVFVCALSLHTTWCASKKYIQPSPAFPRASGLPAGRKAQLLSRRKHLGRTERRGVSNKSPCTQRQWQHCQKRFCRLLLADNLNKVKRVELLNKYVQFC